ncbi:MAG TPA: Crp/Fnr family transcriptional regulator [Burkholderiales bacterium]|nr:Crp/Fnr family transcriptional regulator [Burkholderiales bacterium]
MQSKSMLLGLQKIELFKGLDSYSLRDIAAQCRWIRCSRNEYVMRRGDLGCEVHFVVAGSLRITAAAGRGRRIIFHDIGAGDIFGEHSALDGYERLADVRALRESLIAFMPGEVFRSIVASHGSVRERLLQRLARSARELTERLLELGAQPVPRRIRIELLRLARTAGVDANCSRLDPAPTHSEVASRVGTAREQVTRELSRLARQGVLERAGRTLVLRDVAALEFLAAHRGS